MATPTPGPRLPLEPSERPLYQPPGRIGCSGVTLVSVISLLAFAFCLQVIAPALTGRLAEIRLPRAFSLDTPTPTTAPAGAGLDGDRTPLPEPTLTAGALPPTPTAGTVPTTTPPPAPATPTVTATPAPVYVAVANTDGTGVYLRADPRSDGRRLVAVPEKTLLLIVGPDTSVDGKVWRNVRTTKGSLQTGWVLAQYLAAPPGP